MKYEQVAQERKGGQMTYLITPVPKPRQTRSDKWKNRPSVLRYRDFADTCRAAGIEVATGGDHIIFIMPMPPSWTKKKKTQFAGKPHTLRPDVDNLLKALLDAVYDDDSAVWDIRVSKTWGYSGAIQILREVGL